MDGADLGLCKIAIKLVPTPTDTILRGKVRKALLIEVRAFEAEEFATAIPGVDVEYVRTGPGSSPCRMTVAGTDDAQLSVGSMGFSAIARSEIPGNVGVFVLITAVPVGGRYCGIELGVGQLFFYAPGTSFVGVEAIGLEASILTVPTDSMHRAAEVLADTVAKRSVQPLPRDPAVERLASLLASVSLRPECMDDAQRVEHLLEAAIGALTADPSVGRDPTGRRLASRRIVVRSIDYVESTQTYQPTMGQLCRAASTSKSRLRQAFVDMYEMPPTKYFQHRLLSRLRDELLPADPSSSSVTDIASSLGIAEFGRLSGRYRGAFGELPSATLLR